MQKAISLSLVQFKNINALPSGVSVVYLGSEYCEHLVADFKSVKKAVNICDDIVLSLPILTDKHLKENAKLIDKVLKLKKEIEISVNDYGTLSFFQKQFGKNIKISVGRILFSLLAKNSLDYISDFKKEYDINYFETDDAHTAESFLMSKKYLIAYHYPYSLYSLTRICPYNKTIVEKCDLRCEDNFVPLNGGELFLRGNSYLKDNKVMPDILPQRLILTYNLNRKIKDSLYKML